MSLWSRIGNVFRGERLSREIEEEMQSHIARGRRNRARCRRSTPRIRFAAAIARGEPRRKTHPLARFAARRCDLRLAAALKKESDFGRRDPVARACDRRLHLGLPADRRPAAASSCPWRIRSSSIRCRARESGLDGKPDTFDGWAYPAFQLHARRRQRIRRNCWRSPTHERWM